MNLKDIDVRQVYRNWKSDSDDFESFVRSGPFVSLKTYEDFHLNMSFDILYLQQRYYYIVQNILNCKKSEFVLCDFNFDSCLEISFLLNNIFSIKPIISFNMLFHPYGLIGTRANIENLVKYGLNLKKITPKGYVFMCDYGRYQDFKEDEYKKKLNNQYEICDADLPYVETLKMLGYNKVVFFTEKDIKKDIQGYLNYLENSNVQIEIKMI